METKTLELTDNQLSALQACWECDSLEFPNPGKSHIATQTLNKLVHLGLMCIEERWYMLTKEGAKYINQTTTHFSQIVEPTWIDDEPMTIEIPRPFATLEDTLAEQAQRIAELEVANRRQADELLAIIEGLKTHNAELQTELDKRELAPVAPVDPLRNEYDKCETDLPFEGWKQVRAKHETILSMIVDRRKFHPAHFRSAFCYDCDQIALMEKEAQKLEVSLGY